jgi:hypothetical protein
MAIPWEQFQKGSDTSENNILNFLKGHPDEDFTPKKITEAFGSIDPKSDMARITSAAKGYLALLDSFVNKSSVGRKIIGGVPHYIFLEAT